MTKENNRPAICIVSIMFFITIVLDIIQCKYFTPWLERMFTYDITGVIPIGLALWAFSTGMIIFWFGKSSESYMGITYKEIYNAIVKKQKWIAGIEEISVCSIIVTLLASFYEWKITFILCTLLQFLTMLIMYRIIKKSVSKEEIRELIRDNINDTVKIFESVPEEGILQKECEIYIPEDTIFVKALSGLNWGNDTDRQNFINILYNSELYMAKNGCAIVLGRFITDRILTMTLSETVKFEMILDLFMGNEANAFDLQKGILFSLVENFNYGIFDQIKNLINCVDKEKGEDIRTECIAWCVVVFIFLIRFQPYETNSVFLPDIAEYLEMEAKFFPGKEWGKDMLDNWYLLCGLQGCESIGNMDMLMKIVEEY